MKLKELIQYVDPNLTQNIVDDVEVSGICHDSRFFKEGDLFVAIRGSQFDGHEFIDAAIQKNAAALVVEDEKRIPSFYKGFFLKAQNIREVVDKLSSKFYDFPSSKMFMAGITGTNGKTTTSQMIYKILSHKMPTAVMGTIDYRFASKSLPSSHTTPDAIEMQKILAQWESQGAKAVSMEVSSHALALHRVDSLQFDVAVFTNLTRDHLDFHITMEEYESAKAKLFQVILKNSQKEKKRAIVNGDDSHCRSMICKEIPTWIYGKTVGDFRLENYKLGLDESEFKLITPVGSCDFRIKSIGLHNIYNSMAAVGVGLHAGMQLSEIATSLNELEFVPGRLQRVDFKNPVRVFVDYAHSDDALKSVLGFLKNLKDQDSSKNKIITVFGCGGDRDKGKRPLMMKAVETYSDLIVVTSDNPRTENPEAIINNILQGATPLKIADGQIIVEADRRKAIEIAIQKADSGDVVLIAGKGHENYQIIGTQKFPFDDYLIAKEILNKK
ncbi:MAG: UDP-N-acetylmuramoyl-L-alanyl-D-glutamate--2,6-diaminopimelate ligase [Oligoflexia bacterium]|nr:UDP-N-acetylmuramoyl-L-alanyl-D-glutamate--2,6-diaminopimelate ligase [Oligoflexia bacterium]